MISRQVFSVVVAGWRLAGGGCQRMQHVDSYCSPGIGSVVIGIMSVGCVLEASVVAGLIAIAYSLLAGAKIVRCFQLVTIARILGDIGHRSA